MRSLLLASALALSSPVLPANAGESATYDLSIRGLRVGTVSYSGEITDGRYSVTGRLQSGGVFDWVKHIRYDASSTGLVRGDRFTPQRYVEAADTGKRQSEAVMEYRNGVPQVKVYNPPREPGSGGLDPAKQGGTVDPLTAMFAALRDVPAADACDLTLQLFDGKRRSLVTIGPLTASAEGATCAGEYRRVAGFSDSDMAEKTRFPFTLALEQAGDGKLQVTEITMDTLYGKGRMKRR